MRHAVSTKFVQDPFRPTPSLSAKLPLRFSFAFAQLIETHFTLTPCITDISISPVSFSIRKVSSIPSL